MAKKLIIAIDGPSGAGKSTLSRRLADRLGYLNIDTGAMYRSVALAAQRAGVDPEDEQALELLLQGLEIGFHQLDGQIQVLLNGEDVSAAIRSPEISLLTSQVAASAPVRKGLVQQQRKLGAPGGVVLEGRDIGSVVFPKADIKFFLSASAAERGRRRYLELCRSGQDVELSQTIADVEQRDRKDRERTLSPLLKPVDAVEIDSDSLSIEQVLELMLTDVARVIAYEKK